MIYALYARSRSLYGRQILETDILVFMMSYTNDRQLMCCIAPVPVQQDPPDGQLAYSTASSQLRLVFIHTSRLGNHQNHYKRILVCTTV